MFTQLLPACLFFVIWSSRIEASVIPATTLPAYKYQVLFGKEKPWDITKWTEDKDPQSTGAFSYIHLSPPAEGVRMKGQLSTGTSLAYYGQRYTQDEAIADFSDATGIAIELDPLYDDNLLRKFTLEVCDENSVKYTASFEVEIEKVEFKTYPYRTRIPFSSFEPSISPDFSSSFKPEVLTQLGIYVRGSQSLNENQRSFDLFVKAISIYSTN